MKNLTIFNFKDTFTFSKSAEEMSDQKKWAFSNMVSILSTHIISNIDATKILNNPEKAWSEKNKATRKLYVK